MKNFNFFITVLALVIAMVASNNAVAQNVVNNISTNDAAACANHLRVHPLDTIVSSVQLSADTIQNTKVYLVDGVFSQQNFRREIKYTVVTNKKVRNVKKNDNQVVVVFDVKGQDGSACQDTTTFNRSTVKDMSFQEKEAYLTGDLKVVNPEHKDLDGNFRHRVYAGVGGGAVFARATSPEASIHLGYETCHYLWELEGIFSSTKYTESADYQGRYMTFSGLFNAGWKFWQDNAYHQSIAIMAFGGYGYQKSDGDEAMDRSRNYGLVGGAKLRYTYKVSNWHFWGEAGWKVVPEVERGKEQNCNAGGFFFSVAVARAF